MKPNIKDFLAWSFLLLLSQTFITHSSSLWKEERKKRVLFPLEGSNVAFRTMNPEFNIFSTMSKKLSPQAKDVFKLRLKEASAA